MLALEMAVKSRLEDVFGKGIAMLIVANAFNSARTPITGLEREDYLELIKAICSDERVISVWGEAGCQALLTEWINLVK